MSPMVEVVMVSSWGVRWGLGLGGCVGCVGWCRWWIGSEVEVAPVARPARGEPGSGAAGGAAHDAPGAAQAAGDRLPRARRGQGDLRRGPDLAVGVAPVEQFQLGLHAGRVTPAVGVVGEEDGTSVGPPLLTQRRLHRA